MKKIMAMALIALLALSFVSANGAAEAPTAKEETLKLGMIASIFGTQSFNDDVKNGLEMVKAKYGTEYIALEVPKVADTENSIRTLIAQGCNFIIVPSADYQDGMLVVADDNKDVKFLYLADVVEGHSNIACTKYAENEGAFLAGALAALLTKTNNVGSVAAVKGDIVQERYSNSFKTGAKYVNPDVTVQSGFTNSYADINKGQEIASVMYNNGADIVSCFAGACNLGVFNAANAAGDGKYCFGAATGQFDKMPNKIVASLVKPVDETIAAVIGQYIETKEFQAGGTIKLGLSNAGVLVRVTTMNPELAAMVTPEIQAKLDEITQKINSGEIVCPSSEAEAAAFVF